MKRKIFYLILCLFLLSGCKSKNEEIPEDKYPIVTMSIKDYGTIKIELYPNMAYNTVANFVSLIENGFYDDNAITRVQKGFVIQAGGLKNPGYTIDGEFKSNGYSKNTLSHSEGVVSMARSNDPDSASGQFFIVLDDSAKYSLDGSYAGFGKVIEGMDIIHEIENSTSLEFADTSFYFLTNYITIESASVDTFGITYNLEKND